MKKILALCTSAVLGLGLAVGGATVALADDGTDETTTVESTTEAQAPDPAPAPVQEETPDPVVVESQPTPVEETPAQEDSTEQQPTEVTTFSRMQNTKLPICHSGSGNHWTYIAPDANGYNGHKNHVNDIYGLSEADCLAKNVKVEPTDEDYVTVAWLAGDAPPNHFDVPQTYLFSEETEDPSLSALDDEIAAYLASLKCGTDADLQVDVYKDDSTTTALIAGGVLYGPNNPTEHLISGGEGTAWKFVHLEADDCPPPPPPAQECVVGGDYHESDDNAAVQGQYGLDIFSQGGGKATDGGGKYLTSGNAQGFTSIDWTKTGEVGNGIFFRLIFDLSADGGSAYNSFSGLGTHVDQSTVAGYGSKAVFNGKSIADVATTWPHNKLVAIIWQTGSSYPAGEGATLVSYSGYCGSGNFVPEQPEAVKGSDKTEDTSCEYINSHDGKVEVTTTPRTQEYVWDNESHTYVLGEKQYGEPVVTQRDATEAEIENCPNDQPYNPQGPSQHDVCGVANDTLTVPDDNEFGDYSTDDQRVDGVGTVIVTFTPNEGYYVPSPGEGDTYVLDDSGRAVWSFDYTNQPCPPDKPEEPENPFLALTGSDSALPLGLAAVVVIGLGIVFLVRRQEV